MKISPRLRGRVLAARRRLIASTGRLPTQRLIAAEAGVNQHEVSLAMEGLSDDGFRVPARRRATLTAWQTRRGDSK